MPYKLKSDMRAAQHRWYESHKDITRIRAREWKQRQRVLKKETTLEKHRRLALEYYYKNRERILANNNDKDIRIESATINSDFVSARMQKLIEQFGEADAKWFEAIRIKICAGVKFEYDNERWWNMLKSKTASHIGLYCFEKPTKGKYSSPF